MAPLGVGAGKLLVACVTLSLVSFAVTYPVSVYACKQKDECLKDQNGYFLSNTINYPYASCIGSFMLSCAVVLLFAVLCSKNLIVQEKLEGRELVGLVRVNRNALWFGFVTVVGGLGVCSFQLGAIEGAHMTAAFLFFAGGLATTIAYTYIDYKLMKPGIWDPLVKLRVATIAFALSCILGWFILIMCLHSHYHSTAYEVSAAAFEIIVYLCLQVLIGSWYQDLSLVTFTATTPFAAGYEPVQ